MERSLLIFDNSPWLIVICLIVGGVLSFALYRKPGPWSLTVHYSLLTIRFLLISLLCFLLIGPIIKQFRNTVEQPRFVIALDNSTSVAEVLTEQDLENQLNEIAALGQGLNDDGYSVEFRTYNQVSEELLPDSIAYDQLSSPLNQLLHNIQTDYEGGNLSGVVLVSDGIHNQGLSPTYSNYSYPVYTVGLGDTIPQKDIRLKSIHYNKLAYQGNKFIIRAEVLNDGFSEGTVDISVSNGARVLQNKTLSLQNPPQFLTTDFEINATSKGLKDYTITLSTIEGEFTVNNNQRHAYIEVIEGNRNILLASKNPHPDLKAIKNSIEKNQNYKLHLYIPGISEVSPSSLDLIILHQISLPELQQVPELAQLLKVRIPQWTIVGSRSNINRVNATNPLVSIKTINFQKDLVTPSYNPAFAKFQLSPTVQETIRRFNPVTVPFANYQVANGAEILLFQRVGNLVTDNPLLVISDDGDYKSALMIGEGLWQWRMQDFSLNQNFDQFDELMSKLIQYLSSNQEKSRFKVYPVTQEFNASEPVILKTEVYNEIYEETFGYPVELELQGPNDFSESYSYVTSQGNSNYRISDLPPGIYSYAAQTSLDGKPARNQGQFTIAEMPLESLNLTADHNLLRNLSSRSNGAFYQSNQWQELSNDLLAKKAQGVVFSEEIFTPLIKWPWALAIILILVCSEWFLRKFHGTY